MSNLPTIKEFQKRLANITISGSTLRNQGNRGVIDIAREFLEVIDLAKFVTDENTFLNELNIQTEMLRERFPTGAQNWGAARKAINLFLAECCYHRFICREYHLEKIEKFLEIALDSQVANFLIREAFAKDITLPRWQGLKRLLPPDSYLYQEFAYKYAKERKLAARFYLDVLIWRSEGLEITGK